MTSLLRRSLVPAVALLAVVAVLSACGGDDEPVVSTTTTTTASTTTAADGDKVDEGGQDEADVESWRQTAGPYRGKNGDTVEIECDPGGAEANVWGTNVYTDDSSICTAAVHQGLITFDDGGTVTIEIAEGEAEYIGSDANGVTTSSYGAWSGSFVFPDADPLDVAATIDWGRSARFYADRDDTEFTVDCEPGGTPGNVWGTGTFTDDSSICTAAVHDGLITNADGGEVRFRLVPGQDSYSGSEANGVLSKDYGEWGASFVFENG